MGRVKLLDAQDEERVVKDAQDGLTLWELAQKYACCKQVIQRVLKERGVKLKLRGGKTRVNRIDLGEVARLEATGLSMTQAAEQMGIWPESVTRARRRKASEK